MAVPNPIPEPLILDRALGDDTGMMMPAHATALEEDGAAWLTAAFRRFGSISPDNSVAQIVSFERCSGGSTGAKYLLDVEWARADPALETALFVKFSRDFSDSRRDHPGRYEMAAEAPFMALARSTGFPIDVAEPYFADFQLSSGTGIVITARVPFGEGRIETHREKSLDFQTLDDPLPYYKATVTALARLAGAHQSGQLSKDIDARFPFDPVAGSADLIRYDQAGLAAVLDYACDFTARCPQHFPDRVRTPQFLAQLRDDAQFMRENEAAVRRFLIGNPAMIALNHWNAHIDNAFFWRDQDELQCGLIDWGRVGQITLGSALWGGLSAAHHAVWDQHLDELLGVFVEEYRLAGGPQITVAELEQHLLVHIGAMGVARVLAFPEIITFRFPDVVNAASFRDPELLAIEPARNCLHVFTVFLKLWEARGIGECIRRVVDMT